MSLTLRGMIRSEPTATTGPKGTALKLVKKRREEKNAKFDTSGSDPHWIPLRADTK